MDEKGLEIIKNPILVTGCPRSGTSLTAGSFDICGAWGGKTSGPNQFNKKGMFENSRIRNEILKPYLRRNHWDDMGQKPLPDIRKVIEDSHNPEIVMQLRVSVAKVLRAQGYTGEGRWYYKGAKMCIIWPLWDAAFPDADWVIVRRDAEDIVRSCLKTSFMRKYSERSGWLYWVSQHERRFEEMIQAQLNVIEIWPQRAINGDFTALQNAINKLGLTWHPNEVRNFVDPNMWKKWQGHSRDKVSSM